MDFIPDMYEGMTEDELRDKLPPYVFLNKK